MAIDDLMRELGLYRHPDCEYFSHIESGAFEIVDGSLAPLDFLQEGQYFRIVGSLFNDGVYVYPAEGLTEEKFSGAIWAMKGLKPLLELADDIETLENSIAAIQTTGFSSESYPNGYSYSTLSELPLELREKAMSIERRKSRFRKI